MTMPDKSAPRGGKTAGKKATHLLIVLPVIGKASKPAAARATPKAKAKGKSG